MKPIKQAFSYLYEGINELKQLKFREKYLLWCLASQTENQQTNVIKKTFFHTNLNTKHTVLQRLLRNERKQRKTTTDYPVELVLQKKIDWLTTYELSLAKETKNNKFGRGLNKVKDVDDKIWVHLCNFSKIKFTFFYA